MRELIRGWQRYIYVALFSLFTMLSLAGVFNGLLCQPHFGLLAALTGPLLLLYLWYLVGSIVILVSFLLGTGLELLRARVWSRIGVTVLVVVPLLIFWVPATIFMLSPIIQTKTSCI